MPIHPILTAALIMDVLVLILLAGAAASAFRVALHWTPDDTGRRQLALQARQEAWSLATTVAAWVYLAGGFLLVGALTTILPGLVPGAMCGTGVLQSCAPFGYRLLILRFMATVGLLCWQRMETLNRSDPLASLTVTNARVLLMLLPILILGFVEYLQALNGLETHQPVDCCTALYDRVAAAAGEPPGGRTWHAAAWAFGLATAILPLAALNIRSSTTPPAVWPAAALALVALAWLATGLVTLVRILAPYHYEVLHHHCPWCLFLPEHRFVGFPLLVCWGLVAVEATALWALVHTRAGRPEALPAANKLLRGARRRLLIGVFGFVFLAAGPALWWRWQFGLWIAG